ncbi:hypothetical protein Tco_0909814 [Tanacetum coccineum]|uniref:Uncharacterized protein n=1 Tax=Tanacetum coccineum TaxID=301880 RepID=A0ABQ5CS26_9ASTR
MIVGSYDPTIPHIENDQDRCRILIQAGSTEKNDPRFKESTHRRPKFHSSLFRKLEAVDATFLEASISMDEMKEVVWSCSGSKSPGPDGINFNLLRRSNLSKSRLYGVGVPLNEVASVAEAINCAHITVLLLFSFPVEETYNWDPIKIIKRLEVIRSRFFWGFNEDSRKMVWINWNKTIMEKGMGGLGVRSIRAKNLSLLGKWTWRFHTEDTVLWRKVIKEIYGPDGGFSHMAHQGSRMGLWSEIVKSNKSLWIKLLNWWKLVVGLRPFSSRLADILTITDRFSGRSQRADKDPMELVIASMIDLEW